MLVCDPEDPAYALIKREMPLTGLLLTVTPLSSAVKRIQPMVSFNPEQETVLADDVPVILTMEWARRYFEAAPLTYGALGISTGCHDEFSRFVWSMLSWSPQPGVFSSSAPSGPHAPQPRCSSMVLQLCGSMALRLCRSVVLRTSPRPMPHALRPVPPSPVDPPGRGMVQSRREDPAHARLDRRVLLRRVLRRPPGG